MAKATNASGEAKPKKEKVQKEAKAPVTKVKKIKVYSLKKKPTEKDKITPQARVILEVVGEKGPIERNGLIKALEGKIKTNQELSKVFGFYRRLLVEDGFLTEKVEEVEEKKAA